MHTAPAVDSGLQWSSASAPCSCQYLLPRLLRITRGLPGGAAVLDIGCGNGYLASRLAAQGRRVIGVDPSPSGIEIARRMHPNVEFRLGSAYDDLCAVYGKDQFDAVVAVEVIEHLCQPRQLVRNAFSLLKPCGVFVICTPYHGYLKNLILAVTGRLDAHFTALWDGGHVKFWSRRTLTQLLGEAGFVQIRVDGVGRLPLLWKAMVATSKKPALSPA